MTTYTIKKSDSSTLVELAEGQTDKVSSSLTLVGKNVYNFGESQNSNLLHLLENFANTSSPTAPTIGQLWYDTSGKILKVFKGNATWSPLPTVTVVPTPTTSSDAGSMLFNTTTGQLFVSTGTDYVLIGPDATPGYGTTRLISTTLLGTENPTPLAHPVIKCVVGDQVIALISSNTFNINTSNSLPSFTTVYKGITLNSAGTQLFGIATRANSLLNQAGNSYLSASTSTTVNSIVQRDGAGNTAVNNLKAVNISASGSLSVQDQVSSHSIATSDIYGSNGTLHGDWTSNGTLYPATNAGSNLGGPSMRWGNVYTQLADANQVTFANLVDSAAKSVTGFDTDTTLAANSDNKLVTQKAVKTYIDSAISSIQNQLNNLQTVPTGTIMFTAGSAIPNGFIAANGAQVSKAVYSALFSVIGYTYGTYTPSGPVPAGYFLLPDLRGEFIRGWDAGRGVDSGRALGSYQSDVLGPHQHDFDDVHHIQSDGATNFKNLDGSFGWPAKDVYGVQDTGNAQNNPSYGIYANPVWDNNGDGGVNDNAIWTIRNRTAVGNTGGETRPKNVAMMGIIKY